MTCILICILIRIYKLRPTLVVLHVLNLHTYEEILNTQRHRQLGKQTKRHTKIDHQCFQNRN